MGERRILADAAEVLTEVGGHDDDAREPSRYTWHAVCANSAQGRSHDAGSREGLRSFGANERFNRHTPAA